MRNIAGASGLAIEATKTARILERVQGETIVLRERFINKGIAGGS